jgi:plastocyanin
MRRAVRLVALVLVAAVVAGCGGGGAQQPSQPAAQPPAGQASPAGQAPAPASSPATSGGAVTGSEVRIVGKDNLWEPVNVTVKAGQEYEFVVKNEGTTVHNYIINSKDQVGQDFASDVAVNAGQESKFKVKIDKAGTYKVTCTYHPEMTGEVKVE